MALEVKYSHSACAHLLLLTELLCSIVQTHSQITGHRLTTSPAIDCGVCCSGDEQNRNWLIN